MASRTSGQAGFAAVEAALAEIRAGRFVSSSTTRTARTRATCPSPPNSSRPTRSTSWPATAAASFAASMTGERLRRAANPDDGRQITTPTSARLHVPVEARHGVTTGISADDRAHTVQVLIDPQSGPDDLVMPGHMFPLRAREGGVLVRAGQTEATSTSAGWPDCIRPGVLCEIMKADGTWRGCPTLRRFAGRHNLKIICSQGPDRLPDAHGALVERVRESRAADRVRRFRMYRLPRRIDPAEHIALVMGDINDRRAGARARPRPVRHWRRLWIAALRLRRADCSWR